MSTGCLVSIGDNPNLKASSSGWERFGGIR